MTDNVNHPSHYNHGGMETIDVIQGAMTDEEFRGFLKGNIIKYVSRANYKGGNEDLEKARWYLDKLTEPTDSALTNDQVKTDLVYLSGRGLLFKISSKQMYIDEPDVDISDVDRDSFYMIVLQGTHVLNMLAVTNITSDNAPFVVADEEENDLLITRVVEGSFLWQIINNSAVRTINTVTPRRIESDKFYVVTIENTDDGQAIGNWIESNQQYEKVVE